jgi:hypothetical protein
MSNSDLIRATSERRDFGIASLGGPTVAIDNAGHRFLSDPTFDPPRDFGTSAKLPRWGRTRSEQGTRSC